MTRGLLPHAPMPASLRNPASRTPAAHAAAAVASLLHVAIAVATMSPTASAEPLTLTFRGMSTLPAATTDQHGAAFTITGLSGISRRAGNEFVAVMDNSNHLVRLNIALAADGSISTRSIIGGLMLAQSRDFEGIAVASPGLTINSGSVFLAEEGTPAIHEFSLADGSLIRTLDTPPIFATRRANFGFESLTRRALTGDLWTANEEALSGDGPVSSPSSGTTVRLLQFLSSGANLVSGRQYAYTTEPLHGAVVNGARSGLSDLVVLPNGRMIALERSFALSSSGFFQTRIYELDFSTAADVSGIDTNLSVTPVNPVVKRLLYQGSLGNLEGLCLGPRLPGVNHHALIGIIDDGDPLSMNAIVSFELIGNIGCGADFNDDGAVTIQDLFDFLAAYFQGSPDADFNASGEITVQDVFDYLTAYFTACV